MAYQPAQQFTTDSPQPATINDVYLALKLIANLLSRPIWLEPSTARLKTTVEGGTLPTVTTVTTVATVTAVTSITQLGGFDAKQGLLNSTDRNLWSNSVRRAIT